MAAHNHPTGNKTRTRNNKKRQHDDGRAGVSGGAAPRETQPRAPRTATPFAAPGRARAPTVTAANPRHSTLASSAGRCGGDSPLCHSHRQRPAPLRGRGADLRTITPFADALHAQLTFVAARPAPWTAGTPRTPNHITRRRRIEDVRAAIRATWRQPAPITCFRLYAPGVRSPRRSAPPPHAFTASFQLPPAARPASTARRRGRTHSGTVRSARTRAD